MPHHPRGTGRPGQDTPLYEGVLRGTAAGGAGHATPSVPCRTGLAVSAISGQLIVVDARQGRRVKLRIRYKRSRGKDGWRLSNPVDCRWTADIVIGGMDCHAAWAICRRAEVPFRPLIFSVDGNGIVVPDDATLGSSSHRVRSAGKNVVHVWYRRCATGHTCHMSCSQEEADSPTACRPARAGARPLPPPPPLSASVASDTGGGLDFQISPWTSSTIVCECTPSTRVKRAFSRVLCSWTVAT